TGGMQASGGGATMAGNASVTTGSTAAGGAATTAGGDTDTTGGNTNTTGSTTTEGAGGTATTGGATTGGATTGGATTGGTIDPCTMTTPLSGGTQRCSNGLGDLSDGYSWEVWMDSGSNCATYYGVGAAFRQEWNLGGGGDAIARAGLFFGSTQTHEQIGTIDRQSVA